MTKEVTLIIDVPPRYLTGEIHLGHRLSYTQFDFYRRASENTKILYPLCFDGNGLPIEIKVEKEYNIHPSQNLELFLEKCQEHCNRQEKKYISRFKKLEIEYDEKYYYRTDSIDFRKFIQEEFRDLYTRKLITKKKLPYFWCPSCKSILANSEIEYKVTQGKLFKIPVTLDGQEHFFFTLRPELLNNILRFVTTEKKFGNKKRIINNLEYLVLFSSTIQNKFREAPFFIVCGSTKEDLDYLQDANIPFKNYLNTESQVANPHKGSYPFIQHTFNLPTCWRCKNRIEVKDTDSLVIDLPRLKPELLELIKECTVEPAIFENRLVKWIENLNKPWPISRQRFYRTPIPIRKCNSCFAEKLIPGPGYIRLNQKYENCRCGGIFFQNKEVLDTWFDSSSTPFYLRTFLASNEPFSVERFHSHDIIRTWHFYTLVKIILLKKLHKFEIFKYKTMISSFLYRKKGEEMHSSVGNALPLDIFMLENKLLTEDIRMVALNVNPGRDLILSFDAFNKRKKIYNKIIHLTKFFTLFRQTKPEVLIPEHTKNSTYITFTHLLKNLNFVKAKDFLIKATLTLSNQLAKDKKRSNIQLCFNQFLEVLKCFQIIFPGLYTKLIKELIQQE
jgi:valyl-tRNA synthetase